MRCSVGAGMGVHVLLERVLPLTLFVDRMKRPQSLLPGAVSAIWMDVSE
jgi:hypothetical protein